MQKAAELAKVGDEYHTDVYPGKKDWMDTLFEKDDKNTYLDSQLRTVLGDIYEPVREIQLDKQRNRLQARLPYPTNLK